MAKYEAWEDGESLTFSCPETIEAQKEAGLILPGAKKVFETDAETWDEAMTRLHEFKGWEPYVPMKDEPKTAEVLACGAMRTLYGGPHV